MKARPESNEVLVQRLLPSANNDPQDRATAWEEWYTHGGKSAVLSFIRVTNNTTELDMDILQDALTTAYVEVERGRYKPHDGVPFAAYVKGIARNKIREARRRTLRFVPLEDSADFADETADLHLEATVERREWRELLRKGLAKLPPDRRRVLERYLTGHSTAEIAQALGISEASVRQHKCRGLRSLRQMDTLTAYC